MLDGQRPGKTYLTALLRTGHSEGGEECRIVRILEVLGGLLNGRACGHG
jgi:hypothetical protein